MKAFDQLDSYAKLQALAKNPIDLSQEEILTAQRVEKMHQRALDYSLFYATERVTAGVMDALFGLAEETDVIKKMAAMQAGEIINCIEGYESEKRAVLHTAMRDQFSQSQKDLRAKDASERAAKELQKLQQFLQQIEKKNQFTDLIQIGIGGSDLGPRALYLALAPFRLPDRHVHYIANVDPDDAVSVLNQVSLKNCLVVVVSKSGTTLETLTNEAMIRKQFIKEGLDPRKHIIAVTSEKSPMDDPEQYLASFYIWDFVGGRYSSTSMAGAVSLAFAIGFSAWIDLLRGAHAMDLHALEPRNLPLTSALLGIWNRNFLGMPAVTIVPYSQGLVRFPAHLQQLDMESNGKRVDRMGRWVTQPTGPIILGEIGTNAQHSFFQLIHQGTDCIPLEFIAFEKSQYGRDIEVQSTTSQEKLLANLFAQSIALATGQKNDNPNRFFPGNRPNRILLGRQLEPYSLGVLLAFYEHKVAFQGFIWNINSFDQEGVQLGKVLASRILDHFAQPRTEKKPQSFPAAQAYLRLLAQFRQM
jgi:glucose-6-phosphate isomerase